MAEAVVDGTPMSRFFCHKCSIEIERLLPDYKCPQCASGFIEELEDDGNDSGSEMDRRSGENMRRNFDLPPYNVLPNGRQERDFFDMMFDRLPYPREQTRIGNIVRDARNRRLLNSSHHNSESRGSNRPIYHNQDEIEDLRIPLENFFQDILLNLSGAGTGHTVTQDGQPPVFNIRLFLGNPGDYVWGRDGLDAIVTQLLNQMDGTGPPPLPRKQIDEIPTTVVTQSQVDSKLQCSVCWEDFKLDEPVRQLPCQHVYHAQCIVPWLELHGTCPICRQSLGDQSSAEANQDTVRPTLAALFSGMDYQRFFQGGQ